MRELTVPTLASDTDIWSFFKYNEASEHVPCNSLRIFMLLILSPETHKIMNYPEAPMQRSQCVVYGPPAEDANCYEEPMNGRLKARYMLTAEEIHNPESGLSEDEKQLLLSAVRKKANTDTKLFARTLNLRRVL